MTQEKYYTPREAGELLGLSTATITDYWTKGKFPNAKLSENKVLQIPESDLKLIKSPFITAVKPPILIKAEPIPPQISKIEETTVIDDNSIQLAKIEADRLITEAQEHADAIILKANEYYANKLNRADKDYLDKVDSATMQIDNDIKDKQLTLASLKLDHANLLADLDNIKSQVIKALHKYNEIKKATIQNRNYHYNMAMADKWGRFYLWLIKLIKV